LPAHHAIDPRSPVRAGWLAGGFDLGALTGLLPLAVVRQAVADCGRAEQRVRALPAVLVVYFVIGLALFSGQGYREVLRKISVHLRPGGGGYPIATSSALSRARRRLGPEPLERLFGWSCRYLSGPQPPQAYAFGRLLAAMDGTVLDVPGTTANAAAFGPPPSAGGYRGGGQGGYPQVRLVALVACGTRAVIDAAFGRATPASTSWPAPWPGAAGSARG
jgi:Insertion element 4 transposase N-terminal